MIEFEPESVLTVDPNHGFPKNEKEHMRAPCYTGGSGMVVNYSVWAYLTAWEGPPRIAGNSI